jgi:hypothetical protein
LIADFGVCKYKIRFYPRFALAIRFIRVPFSCKGFLIEEQGLLIEEQGFLIED